MPVLTRLASLTLIYFISINDSLRESIRIIKPTAHSMQRLNLLMVALKMLLNSRKKFVGMLVGASFSAFIIMQQPGTYQGVTDRLVAQIHSIHPMDLWVMGRESWDFSDPTYFNALDIYRIRSIPGVLWAKKLYRSWFTVFHPKTQKMISLELIGVDPRTLKGLPNAMLAGDRDSIRQANAIILDGHALKQFETSNHVTVAIGDKMLDGPRTLIVTGMTQPLKTYSSHAKAYMTYDHIPGLSGRPYFILVKAVSGAPIQPIASAITSITGYDALTTSQFSARALQFFREKTPIIIIFISVAILGFTIGLVVMWQIFSNFTLTHLHQFGMLKMLGVSNALLIQMVFFQAAIIGGAGYLIGLMLALLFGVIFHDTNIAFHLTWGIVLLGAIGTALIISIASYFSISKVLRLDTVDLCRDSN